MFMFTGSFDPRVLIENPGKSSTVNVASSTDIRMTHTAGFNLERTVKEVYEHPE